MTRRAKQNIKQVFVAQLNSLIWMYIHVGCVLYKNTVQQHLMSIHVTKRNEKIWLYVYFVIRTFGSGLKHSLTFFLGMPPKTIAF